MRIEDFTNFCKKSTKLINMVKYKICTTGICIILFVTIFCPQHMSPTTMKHFKHKMDNLNL